MATHTAIRSQRYRASGKDGAPTARRGYAARKFRSSLYRTTDGMTRELLRRIID